METYSDGLRYVLEQDFSVESISEFAQSVLYGTAPVYIKSAPIPESNDKPVKVLVGNTFDELVLQTNQSVLVDFYAPRCPHCQALEPVLDELAEMMLSQTQISIAKMDVTENDAPVAIEHLPTIMLFVPGFEDPIVYEGDRSLEDLASFVIENTPAEMLTAVELDGAEETQTDSEPDSDTSLESSDSADSSASNSKDEL